MPKKERRNERRKIKKEKSVGDIDKQRGWKERLSRVYEIVRDQSFHHHIKSTFI